MLEMPEAATIARQLNEVVKGKRIAGVVANGSPHGFAFFTGNDPSAYEPLLKGKEIGEAKAYGGIVEIGVQEARVQFFDGVNVRYLASGDKRPDKHQLLIELEDGTGVVCTVQMYGALLAYVAGEMEDNMFYSGARDKPSPLTDGFTREHFASICDSAKPTLSAKALLATEQRIPGLGNGTLQDILFAARIHPKRKRNKMGDAELDALFASVKNNLAAITEQGGRDTEKDLFGRSGGYRTLMSSKTYKEPCPVCGGEIIRQAYMGGNVYFCPTCQPLEG